MFFGVPMEPCQGGTNMEMCHQKRRSCKRATGWPLAVTLALAGLLLLLDLLPQGMPPVPHEMPNQVSTASEKACDEKTVDRCQTVQVLLCPLPASDH